MKGFSYESKFMDNNVDHVYYNISMRGGPYTNKNITTNLENLVASYDVTLNNDIIDNAREYHMAIIRFTIPFDFIPFIYMPIQDGASQSNPNLSEYVITLTYSGNYYPTTVIYVPEIDDYPTPLPPSLNGGVQVDSIYYYVDNVYKFISMINTALATSMTELLTDFPSLSPMQPPILVLDEPTGTINLIVDYRFYSVATLELFFNVWLYALFDGMNIVRTSLTYPTNKDLYARLVISTDPLFTNAYYPPGTPTNITPPPYLYIQSAYSQLSQISSPYSIIFKSSRMVVRNEYTSAHGGDAIVENIIADFLISEWNGNRDSLYYVPPGVYRYIDLISDNPLRTIDVQAYWSDKNGNIRPLYIGVYNPLNMKLAFVKRSLVS